MEDSMGERLDRLVERMLITGGIGEVINLVKNLTEGDKHDISIPFRACLIAQGFETEALKLAEVTLILGKTGFGVSFMPNSDPGWLDNRTPELTEAFTNALIWTFRAANIDAFINAEGEIDNRGPILILDGDEDEVLVGQFRTELDEQFPDVPPKREGKWW